MTSDCGHISAGVSTSGLSLSIPHLFQENVLDIYFVLVMEMFSLETTLFLLVVSFTVLKEGKYLNSLYVHLFGSLIVKTLYSLIRQRCNFFCITSKF